MKNTSHNDPPGVDFLKFENDLLKLKLQTEFGVMECHNGALTPELENAWLANIYAFEEQLKNAKRIKVFDALGRPQFKKLDELTTEEVPAALEFIQSLLKNRGIALDCCCQYDDHIIYRFITEELFECEMDDISIDGMVCHFIYEEFYPNHEYDLRGATEQFIRNLLERKWDPEFNLYSLADTVILNRRPFKREALSSVIHAFQSGREFEVETLNIQNIDFSMKKKAGRVNAELEYRETSKHPDHILRAKCEISFLYDDPAWRVSRFRFPGI